LNYELKDKIDVLAYEAGEVSTNFLRRKPSRSVITTDIATRSSLRDIGKESKTSGALIHEL
jgi:hypothetical protein